MPEACAGLRLDQALQKLLPEHSRARLQSWIREEKVRLNGRGAVPKERVWGGERIRLEAPPQDGETAHAAQDIALDIVHEDEAILVVNKPAGLVVHPGSGNREGTLLNALLHHLPRLSAIPRAGIVHRLDKDTSGLLVVAKTLEAQTDLVRQLQARSVKREYLAIVQGALEHDGRIEAPIGRHPVHRTRMAVVAGGKPAATRYQVIEPLGGHTLVRCHLETGRTHQIRVHFQSIAHPLLGDPVYGHKPKMLPAPLRSAVLAFGRQALHAARLGLLHPVAREVVQWAAPTPSDMAELMAVLRREAGLG